MIVAYVADLIVNDEVINVKGIIGFNSHMPVLPLAQIADWVARENATILNKQISNFFLPRTQPCIDS